MSRPTHLALEPAAEELEAVLRDSVRAHLRSDVPLGVLLSSGLDSRTVAAYAQESLSGGPCRLSRSALPGRNRSWWRRRKPRAEIGSKHHALEITAGDLSGKIGRVAWHLDEPVGDPAAFAVLRGLRDGARACEGAPFRRRRG